MGPVDQVPPVVASCSVIEEPAQTAGPPVMAGGGPSTVTNAVTVHPPAEYVIVEKPSVAPYTVPVAVFIVATPVLLLLQVPPVVPSLSDADEPSHIVNVPRIPDGTGFIVTIVVAGQPLGGVKIMVAVPADAPHTVPDVGPDRVATAVLPLLHVPVPVSVSVVLPPWQACSVPLISDGTPLTVTTTDFVHP